MPMDRLILSKVDEELETSEVNALCFLCRDVVNRKRLENVVDGKGLFVRLEERGLLDNAAFLSQLLQTIGRNDLVNLLRTDRCQYTETDANPLLSDYRVMLYELHDDITQENLEKMKFLLENKLGRAQTEKCGTSLDVFAAMEKKGLLSNANLNELYGILREFDLQLAETVHTFIERLQFRPPCPKSNINEQNTNPRLQPCLSVTESQPSYPGDNVFSDSEPSAKPSSVDETDFYSFTHKPHGLCVVINIEDFKQSRRRNGSHEDERALRETFTSLGFTVEMHKNLESAEMKRLLVEKGRRNFNNEDALVVCVLSHGLKDCVYGSDDVQVSLRDLTQPFTSLNAPSLAGKPKLFFIQACQGSGCQGGSLPYIPKPEEVKEPQHLEEDAGAVQGETVPWDADFLLGMATVPEYKSFRDTKRGSIYIQELCKQLNESAQSNKMDDLLTVLTRVNRNVSKGVYLKYKQIPEPKYTLTKKVVLRYE
uniref:Caspase-8 n=1 Tax=Neogobius melanostomus TaxID=47308 RepID=A0A8C6WVT4_9GOBI